MINVVAIITAKAGMRDELLSMFNANVPAVLAEKGCIEYGAAIDTEGMGSFQAQLGPDTFAVIEKWESKEALMAHAVADHMKEYSKKTKDLAADKAIHILSNV